MSTTSVLKAGRGVGRRKPRLPSRMVMWIEMRITPSRYNIMAWRCDYCGTSRAPRSGMHAEQGPLIPLLSADELGDDPDVLSTWHAALSNTLGVEIPHDLLALWLYPSSGGVALLGPAELAQDELRIPRPAPRLPQDQLFQLEERIRGAGYASAVAVPICFGGRDVGLLLLADLRPGRYGTEQAMLLQRVAARLGATFERLARQWS